MAVDAKVIKTIDSMRQYANMNLEKFNMGQFYKVTNAYFEKGADIFKEDKNIANLGPLFTELTDMPVDAVAMRAWRFWALFRIWIFTGDVYHSQCNGLLVRCDCRIKSGKEKKMYSVSEFVDIVTPWLIL